jgi:hypothetical protein
MVGVTQRSSFSSLLWQTNQFSLKIILFYSEIFELELEQLFFFKFNIKKIYSRKKKYIN